MTSIIFLALVTEEHKDAELAEKQASRGRGRPPVYDKYVGLPTEKVAEEEADLSGERQEIGLIEFSVPARLDKRVQKDEKEGLIRFWMIGSSVVVGKAIKKYEKVFELVKCSTNIQDRIKMSLIPLFGIPDRGVLHIQEAVSENWTR